MKKLIYVILGMFISIAIAFIYVLRDPDMRKIMKSDFDKGRQKYETETNTR